MSGFFSRKYAELTPYTPGEQPQDRQYIKLNTNESPYPPSPLAQRLARQEAGDLQLYSDPECRALVRVAADCFGISPDEIMFTNGSDDILNFAVMAFCDAEHPAVFPDVTYGFYPVFARLNNVPYTEIPLAEDFAIRPEDYFGVKGTILIANPNAPTGVALPLEDIERIATANPDNVVVIDEAYIDFGGESCMGLIGKYRNLLVTRTFSKARSMAGARLGFGVADKELIRDLNTLRFSTNPYNINRMTMMAGVGSLLDEDYYRNCCAKIVKTREETEKALKELGFEMTKSSTNFLFARHPDIGGRELYLRLKERGILIRHFETQRLKDYNRISIGSDEQMRALVETLEALLKEKT
jgi:histidinol-phosphate aminotransferase